MQNMHDTAAHLSSSFVEFHRGIAPSPKDNNRKICVVFTVSDEASAADVGLRFKIFLSTSPESHCGDRVNLASDSTALRAVLKGKSELVFSNRANLRGIRVRDVLQGVSLRPDTGHQVI
jgi:hypothetical protein